MSVFVPLSQNRSEGGPLAVPLVARLGHHMPSGSFHFTLQQPSLQTGPMQTPGLTTAIAQVM